MIRTRNLVVCVFVAFCLAGLVFAGLPNKAQSGVYNPWCDVDDNGIINMLDLYKVALLYGATGTPMAKASIEYDSGWINITDKCGQDIVVTHGLNSVDLTVDIQGKMSEVGGPHQRNYGLTDVTYGWGQTYGRAKSDVAYALIQTVDRGYALAGTTPDSFGYTLDFWLVKTDAAGNAQWNATYGAGSDIAHALVQTSDGGYALAGITTYHPDKPLGYSCWLVKTDAVGNEQWNKTYGGIGDDWANALVQTSDGGYAIAGYTTSFGAVGYDFWLLKTDAAGNVQWNYTYGGTDEDVAYALVQTSDGGYAIAGYTWSYGYGLADLWLLKTDASGILQWNRAYGGTGDDRAYALVQTPSGRYALAGATDSYGAGGSDFWLVRTDGSGTMLFNKTYGGTGEDVARALVQTSDGGYALAGRTDSSGAGGDDFWLVKTDWTGNEQWNKTYGGTSGDGAYALVQTVDGGYALAGGSYSWGAGGCDMLLIKTDVESGLAWIDSSADAIWLHRGATDVYWNFVRIRIWKPKPTP